MSKVIIDKSLIVQLADKVREGTGDTSGMKFVDIIDAVGSLTSKYESRAREKAIQTVACTSEYNNDEIEYQSSAALQE